MIFREERDSVGIMQIPTDAYYGVQSLRGKENFAMTGQRLHPLFIESLAQIKKACAICNAAADELDTKIKDGICQACDEIVEGKFHDSFLCDPLQGGAGTSANMNANEVIANRAIEILNGTKGDYSLVHPNDHVNRSQSTNDVIPTAAKLTTVKLLKGTIESLEQLALCLEEKKKEFFSVIKMGRTQLQDAVPIRLGDEFGAFASAVRRDLKRLRFATEGMLSVNMGGTAIGTGLNAPVTYQARIVPTLAEITGLPLRLDEDRIDGTQNLDSFAFVSSSLKTCAITLSKISNDLRLMSSGPRCGFSEIHLPPMQNGSSIMPGKINPVIPEVMNQACFCVMGNDVTITMASEAGQLELNYAEPVLYFKLFESLSVLTAAVKTFMDRCVKGITANEENCRRLVENSVGIITVICPKVGYQLSAEIAKEAIATGRSVRELLKERKLFSESELDDLLNPEYMV